MPDSPASTGTKPAEGDPKPATGTKSGEDLIREIHEGWGALQTKLSDQDKEIKKHGGTLGDTKESIDKISSALTTLEQKWNDQEKKNNRKTLPADEVDFYDPDELKAFMATDEYKSAKREYKKFMRTGQDISAESVKVMRVERDETGGYGAPPEMVNEILKELVELSPARGSVRVRNTGRRSIRMMRKTGGFTAKWVGEVEERTESGDLTYGLEEIPTHETYALVDISVQDLEDEDFGLESELNMEFSEQFALQEATAVLKGTGHKQPEGILTHAAVQNVNTGNATQLTYDGLVDMAYGIKLGYVASSRFYFNLKTLGELRKMKDANNNPLWVPMAPDVPAQVLGWPYTLWQEMDDVAANKVPIMFGDLRRGFTLVDRVNLEIVRDPYTQRHKGAVRFFARKRLGGQVLVAEAIRKHTVAA